MTSGFATAKVEASRQYKRLSMLLTKASAERKTLHLEEQAEWSTMDAGLDQFYRVVRKFVNLRILAGPSLDALFPSHSSHVVEPSAITHSTLYPFRNVEELRLNGLWLNRREGNIIPSDLIRCLLDLPHIKTLIAHIQAGNESAYPSMHPPSEISCALRHLELTVANGHLMDSLTQFLQLTKELETFKLEDRTTRTLLPGFTNSFMGYPTPVLDIPRVIKALSRSYSSLLCLHIVQYDSSSPVTRERVRISFRQFTALQTLVIPFTPMLPTDLDDIQPDRRCFPKSLTTLTFLRGSRISIDDLIVIFRMLRDTLRELGAYVIGYYGQLPLIVLGKHTVTLGDRFQAAQWMCIRIETPERSKIRIGDLT
ncbi:10155_t:CDS:1 [Acaulospora colombiana]|uniref:10155_t:CDS:1 n=1 Tax=Acaulospora colombiana TaxID=27376 RepID=A0ACA9NNG0_9GLOM|nr:10155_t:CDS:1 [Acaulospora colombiana]